VQGSGSYDGYDFGIGYPSAGKLGWYTKNDPGGTGSWRASTTAVNTGSWVYVAAVLSGTTKILYVNGVVDSTFTGAGAASSYSGNHFVGNDGFGSCLVGSLDEVRISNSARSTDWILTEYRNQSAPATYLTAGPRLTPSVTRVRHKAISGE
jgi:hypothetical protein